MDKIKTIEAKNQAIYDRACEKFRADTITQYQASLMIAGMASVMFRKSRKRNPNRSELETIIYDEWERIGGQCVDAVLAVDCIRT